jgi:hypothetical protein
MEILHQLLVEAFFILAPRCQSAIFDTDCTSATTCPGRSLPCCKSTGKDRRDGHIPHPVLLHCRRGIMVLFLSLHGIVGSHFDSPVLCELMRP